MLHRAPVPSSLRGAGASLALLALVALVGREACAQPAPDHEAARTLYERGTAAFHARRYADALLAFEASYRLRPTALMLYNVGLANQHLGRYLAAIEAWERYLADGTNGLDATQRTELRARVATLRTRLATLSLSVVPEGGEVRVDGRPVAGGSVEVDPGSHLVTVEAEGYEPLRRELSVAQGAREAVTLRLARARAPSGTVERRAATGPSGRATSGGLSPLVWVGGSVAVASAVAATVLWVTGNRDEADYLQRCVERAPEPGCATLQRERQGSLDERALALDLLWGVMGTGALVATVGLVLGLTSRDARPSRPVAVGVGPGRVSLEVRW